MSELIVPYIKGTRRKYGTKRNGGFWGENGYNCIEVGYLLTGGSGSVIEEVLPLIVCADVISIGEILGAVPQQVSMDCVGGGYLRFFSHKTPLKWKTENVPLSNMELVEGEPDRSLFIKEAV